MILIQEPGEGSKGLQITRCFTVNAPVFSILGSKNNVLVRRQCLLTKIILLRYKKIRKLHQGVPVGYRIYPFEQKQYKINMNFIELIESLASKSKYDKNSN
jgi:hypothetical protein